MLLEHFDSGSSGDELMTTPCFKGDSECECIKFRGGLGCVCEPGKRLAQDRMVKVTTLLGDRLCSACFHAFGNGIGMDTARLEVVPFPPVRTVERVNGGVVLGGSCSVRCIGTMVRRSFGVRLW